MMDCNEVKSRLDELVDGELSPERQADLRAHLARCATCDAEVRGALDLRAQLAALPKRVPPARDLWPEIAARIATTHGVVRRRMWPRVAGIAAVAAGIVVASLVTLQQDSAPMPVASSGGEVVVAVDPGLRLAAQSMLDSAELDGRTLPSGAADTVRENLEIIDRAVREIAAALELDPDNPQLQRQLLDAYRGQAGLLDTIARVSTAPAMRTDL